MRVLFLVVWLLLPLPVVAYHFGPGQQKLTVDEVGQVLRDAENAADKEDWSDAVAGYDKALELIPEEYVSEARKIRLERAKAQMNISQLPDAHRDLQSLIDEMRDDPDRNNTTYREALSALANAQYYMTWLMRLEGKSRDEWEPEIESARQILAKLADEADEAGDSEASMRHREDLEASIRLARMALTDLEGLPLPSQ